jgi:hypothetical protein
MVEFDARLLALKIIIVTKSKEVETRTYVTSFNWFFMTPSIASKFQYVNSLLFSFSRTTCFGTYWPSSGEIYK